LSALPSSEAAPSHDCARAVLAAVPPLMQEIRAEMRQAAPAGLSIPQFRALIFARNHPGASVSELAAHLGITVPTASVAVDRLVRQKLLRAPVSPDNRRRRSLQVTEAGSRAVDAAWASTTDAFARRLDSLAAHELLLVQQALALLQRRMAPREPGADA
jgi:DNA-binding MarR family transcriptional regulator